MLQNYTIIILRGKETVLKSFYFGRLLLVVRLGVRICVGFVYCLCMVYVGSEGGSESVRVNEQLLTSVFICDGCIVFTVGLTMHVAHV